MDMDKQNFSVCAVSSVLCNRTSCKHFDITLQRNVDRGRLERMGGGAWLGTCSQHWTSNGNIYVLCAGARVMGVSMVIAAWGRGLCVPVSTLPLVGSLVFHPKCT